MAHLENYKVLYFVNHPVPSMHERRDALQYGPHCAFRNAAYVTSDSSIEACVAVCGQVPVRYAEVFPRAVSIAEYYNGNLPKVCMALEAETAGAPTMPGGAPSPLDLGFGGSQPEFAVTGKPSPAWKPNA